MDPKHEPSQGPSPDDPNRHPHADTHGHEPHAPGQPVPPTGGHGTHLTDPTLKPPEVIDSLVDLGVPGDANIGDANVAPTSGISVIEWAALVEDDPPADAGAAAQIDAPSDADWLKETFSPHVSAADEPVVLEHYVDSGVDLLDAGHAPTDRTPSAVSPGDHHPDDDEPTLIPGSASNIDLDEPDELDDDMEIVRGAFTVESADSKDKMKVPIPELVEVEELELANSGEVQLGAALPDIHDPFATVAPKPEGVESGVINASLGDAPLDLGSPSGISDVSGVTLMGDVGGPHDAMGSGISGVNLVDEAFISDDLASAMLAGGEGSPEDSHFGRDLIAEEVESGVDLRHPVMDVVDEEWEAEAGQAAAVEGDPLQAGTVESAVIDAQLVEDLINEEGGDTVGLGESPKRHGTGSSVNLSGPAPKKKHAGAKGEVDTGDIELGAASGHLLNSGLDFSNDPGIESPKSGRKLAKSAVDADEIDFGSDDDINLPAQSAPVSGAGDSDVLAEVDSAPGEKSGKKQRARSGVGGWLGGGLLGAVVATGACAAAWYLGVIPGTEVKPATRPSTVTPQAVTFETKLAHLRNGDFDKAEEAGIERIDEANPEQLAARGEYRWLSYLKKQRVAGAQPKVGDEEVKQALEDLDKVTKDVAAKPEVVADALLWKGNIQEMTNNKPEARNTYLSATSQFAADPVLKRRFDAARIRLDLQTANPGGVGQLPADERERVVLVTLLLHMLQGDPIPVSPKADATEAGYDFWEAVELARKQNFAEALKKLQSARDLHDKRRFAQLRKSQNPTSDPTEEIFLRTCDELKIYWTMQARLRDGKYLDLTAHTDPDKALVALLAAAAGNSKWAEAVGAKLVEAKVIADPKDVEKGIDQLLVDRKTAEAESARVAKLGDELVKAKVIDKPEDLDQGVTKMLTERTKSAKEVADLKATVETAKTDAKKLQDLAAAAETKLKMADAIKKAIKTELVDATYLDANAGDDKLVPAVKNVVKVARTDADKVAMQKLLLERNEARDQVAAAAARTKEQLADRWQPQEMLSFWLPLLEDRTQKDLPAKAVQDVDRVTKDTTATPAQKAHAEVIKGLILRNQEKFGEAKAALVKAKASLAPEDKTWQTAADAALKEVANPGTAYIARADTLQRQGKYDEAVGALTHAVELVPQDKGNLLAKRSLVQLEAARAKASGRLTANEPLVVAAQKDAKAAADAAAPLGYYAAGRVAEELGQYDAAVQSYRQAVAAHPDLAGDGSLFRIALARALLLTRPDRPAPKVGRLDGVEGEMSPEMVAIFLAFTVQPPLGQPASVEEAVKLADEILKLDKSKVPYEVRAQAFAVKNLWTEAVRTYAEGLRSNLDRAHADELMYLIDNHPKLKGPDSERIANPLMAEAHYGAGIRQYFNKHYDEAEKEFAAAVRNESQDARYHYYLGLSRLAQDKDEAYEDFAQGALLEAKNRPARAAVSAALERVQGPVRTVINEAREKSR